MLNYTSEREIMIYWRDKDGHIHHLSGLKKYEPDMMRWIRKKFPLAYNFRVYYTDSEEYRQEQERYNKHIEELRKNI